MTTRVTLRIFAEPSEYWDRLQVQNELAKQIRRLSGQVFSDRIGADAPFILCALHLKADGTAAGEATLWLDDKVRKIEATFDFTRYANRRVARRAATFFELAIAELASGGHVDGLTAAFDAALLVSRGERAAKRYELLLAQHDQLERRLAEALAAVDSAQQARAMAEATVRSLERQCEHLGSLLLRANIAGGSTSDEVRKDGARGLARGFGGVWTELRKIVGALMTVGGYSVAMIQLGMILDTDQPPMDPSTGVECAITIEAAEQAMDVLSAILDEAEAD